MFSRYSAMTPRTAGLVIALALGLLTAPVAADYKNEFTMSVVPNEETPWGRAATSSLMQ